MRRPEFIARQSARPTGVLGRMLVLVMARETAAFNREVLAAVALAGGERILEVGFGHGRTLALAAKAAPEARLAGVDASEEAVRMATRRCAELVRRGHLELHLGQSSALPWPEASFDKAYSVHTVYFWKEPDKDLGELYRVLKPAGTLTLGFHARTEQAFTKFPSSIYRFYSTNELVSLLERSGFADVEVRSARSAPNMHIAVARKGAQVSGPVW
jgi:ubiquinone/menaquinone biosynthesis C-methylase UbiE